MSLKPQLTYFLGGALSFALALTIAKRFQKTSQTLPEQHSPENTDRIGGGWSDKSLSVSALDASGWTHAEVVDVDAVDEDELPHELVIDSSVVEPGFVDTSFAAADQAEIANSEADPQAALAPEDLGVAWLSRATQTTGTGVPAAPEGADDQDSLEDVTDPSGRPTDPMLGQVFATRFVREGNPR
ncbi:MAG TPA: hypothetical protein VFQ61_10235 [Polyangiaceae bacterium]|nr:hypothetical protein [Polyangiaceae bacterium]